ncbi:hypothetical protein ANN_15636 [Periplaneta americana]|uniref:Uncharacterized protein n=1 Tax=Periplaneta americana TaxID=6978 RepID=A0ABQ8SH02_PERAM|nr:hypothetical protein ANN_15636 [Periplaneta americana]
MPSAAAITSSIDENFFLVKFFLLYGGRTRRLTLQPEAYCAYHSYSCELLGNRTAMLLYKCSTLHHELNLGHCMDDDDDDDIILLVKECDFAFFQQDSAVAHTAANYFMNKLQRVLEDRIAQPIAAELAAKLLGNRVAVSPIVTVEPRRRKFHKPITLTIPVPQAANKGMINQYSGDAPTLRLLCSITAGVQNSDLAHECICLVFSAKPQKCARAILSNSSFAGRHLQSDAAILQVW